MKTLSRFVALTVSTTIFLMSPGFQSYRVFAATFAASNAASQAVGRTAVPVIPQGAVAIGGMASAGLAPAGALNLGSALPSLSGANIGLMGVEFTNSSILPATKIRKVEPVFPGTALRSHLKEGAPQGFAPGRKQEGKKTLSRIQAGVKAELTNLGPMSSADAGKVYTAGGNLISLLSGETGGRFSGSAVAPTARDFGRVSGRVGTGVYFANPAGKDSIAAAVQAQNNIDDRRVVPQAPAAPNQSDSQARNAAAGKKSPLLPKLISAGLGLLPIGLLAVPLLSGGAVFSGILVIAGSAGLMALPFMTENTPEFLRSLPGVIVGGLGVFTVLTGILTGHGIVMGALVSLGGWGLYRWGNSKDSDNYYDTEKILLTFFGSLGAVAGAGLVLAGPGMLLAGSASVALAWTVRIVTWAAYPLTALLLMHLPEWVGAGMESMFRGVLTNGRSMNRVLGSIRRDTVLRDRLVAFTQRHLEVSKWNAIWLGGIWIPVWLSEGAMFLLAVVSGAVVGAAQAPLMFVWGAVHDRQMESRNNKFMAAWNWFVFENGAGSKIKLFNRFEKVLIPYANSKNKALSWAAAAAIRIGQLVWLSYVLAAFVPLLIWGFVQAFSKTAGEYDSKKHSPSSLRANTDDSPDVERPEEPEDPGAPAKSSFFPRLIATAVGLAPMYFLGLPMLATSPIGVIYLSAGIALAAMPFVPQKAPKFLRQAPGYLLVGMGLLTALAVPWFTFELGASVLLPLLSSNIFWMGLVTALSGWGLIRYTGKLETAKRWYSVEDPEYIGAYFGAIGVTTGIGLALLGPAGWVQIALQTGAYLSSLLLLMHLPSWVGAGVGSALNGFRRSLKGFYEVLSFWTEDTDFYKNVKKHSRHWLHKSVWNGSWLSVIWVPTWAIMAAEFVASAALGLAMGLVRVPINFLRGAANELNSDSRWARVLEGTVRAHYKLSEGSKDGWFKSLSGWLWAAMDESAPGSGRPTIKAAAAFGLVRLLQVLWLAGVIVGQPLIFIAALVQGIKGASQKGPNPENPS